MGYAPGLSHKGGADEIFLVKFFDYSQFDERQAGEKYNHHIIADGRLSVIRDDIDLCEYI